MKTTSKFYILLFFIFSLTIISCKKITDSGSPKTNKEIQDITNIIPVGLHNFTDIEVTKEGLIYVVDQGKLQLLSSNGSLTDVSTPAGFYTNFSPDYLAVAEDGSIYLRGLNKLKKLSGNTITSYEYQGDDEEPVDGQYTPNPFVQGNGNIEVDEHDKSLLVNFTGESFDNLIKIKDGKVSLENIITGPFKYYDVCQNGSIWSSGPNEFSATSFLRRILASGVQDIFFNEKGEKTGAINKVSFTQVTAIAVSRDGTTMYFVDQNVLKKVKDLQVSIISLPDSFTIGHIALSPDGKTLYSVGAGIDRIDL